MPVHEAHETKLFRRTMWNKSCTTKHGSIWWQQRRTEKSARETIEKRMKICAMRKTMIEGERKREKESREWVKKELEIAETHFNTANVSKSLNGSKCYNGKILVKRHCRPWNMKLSFRTCINFEYLDIVHINENVLCWWSIDAVALEWSRRSLSLSLIFFLFSSSISSIAKSLVFFLRLNCLILLFCAFSHSLTISFIFVSVFWVAKNRTQNCFRFSHNRATAE